MVMVDAIAVFLLGLLLGVALGFLAAHLKELLVAT